MGLACRFGIWVWLLLGGGVGIGMLLLLDDVPYLLSREQHPRDDTDLCMQSVLAISACNQCMQSVLAISAFDQCMQSTAQEMILT